MAKGKDTPSQEIAKAAKKEASATDARGRLIAVSPLDALQYYNLIKVLGQTAQNKAALDLAMMAATVRAIDTTKFGPPSSEKDIQFVIQTLDFDGIAAAGEALKTLTPSEEDQEAEIEAAKN